jgi:hypothetical protein
MINSRKETLTAETNICEDIFKSIISDLLNDQYTDSIMNRLEK